MKIYENASLSSEINFTSTLSIFLNTQRYQYYSFDAMQISVITITVFPVDFLSISIDHLVNIRPIYSKNPLVLLHFGTRRLLTINRSDREDGGDPGREMATVGGNGVDQR